MLVLTSLASPNPDGLIIIFFTDVVLSLSLSETCFPQMIFDVGISGNPALRQGKPGSGAGLGYGLRYRSPFGSLQLDCAINAFQQKTLYFGITNLAS